MPATTTPTGGKTPGRPADPDRPVRVKNAACPKCGGNVYYSKRDWLHCRGLCPARYALSAQ